MNSQQASRVVFISGTGMVVIVLVQAKRKGHASDQTFRSLWAVGAVTVGLAIFADFQPEVAGPFALLVLIAMVARNSGAIGEVITGVKPVVQLPRRTTGPKPDQYTIPPSPGTRVDLPGGQQGHPHK